MASHLEKLNSEEAVPAVNIGHTPETVPPQSKIQTLRLDVSTVGSMSSDKELQPSTGRSSPYEESDGSASISYSRPVVEEEFLMPTPAKVTKLSTQQQHSTTKDNEFSIYRCLKCNLYLPSLILIQAHVLSHTDKGSVQAGKEGSSDPVSQKPSSDDNLPKYAFIGTFTYENSTVANTCNTTSKRLGINLSAEIFPDKDMSLTSFTRGDNSSFDCYRKRCSFCKVFITSELCFINHLLLYHHKEFQKEDLFRCPVCPNLLFDSFFKSELKSHVATEHKLIIQKCIRCKKNFDSYRSLVYHKDRPRKFNLLDHDLLRRSRCDTCRVFHVLNNVQDKRGLMEEILNTLPEDTSITDFEANHAKLRKSLLSENIYSDIYICKICDIDFPGLACTVDHVINTHFGGLTEQTKIICRTFQKKAKCRLCHIQHRVRANDIQSIKNAVIKMEEKNGPTDAAVISKDLLYILEIIHEKTMEYSNKGVDEFLTGKENKYSCHKCNIYHGWYMCFLNHILNIHLDEEIGAKIEKMHVFGKSEALTVCSLCKAKHSIVCLEKSLFMFYLKLKNMDYENASRELKKWCLWQELRNYICPKYKRFSSIQKTASDATIPSRTKLEIMIDMKERIVCIDNSFVCFVCLLGFDRFSCCKNHVLTSHSELFVYAPGSEVYTCQVCLAVFSCLTSLDVHLEAEHLIFKFVCLKCSSRFNTQKKLKYHAEQHGKNLVKTVFDSQLSCKSCGHIHNCADSEEEEMDFKCEKQDIDSELLECLRLSQYRTTSCSLLDRGTCDPQRPPSSNYSLNHSSDLNTENLSETAFDLSNTEQQFVCKNTNTGQDNLVSNEKVKTKECENYISMIDHYEKNDLYINTLFDGETFYCMKCLKGFETASCCFSHIGWFHENELETSCVICEKSFSDKMLLIEHVKSLHKIEPFYCKMCKEGFDSVADITKHIENCQERKTCPDLCINQICTKCYTYHLTGFELDQTDTCRECVEGFASLKCVTNHYYSIHLPSWVMLASETTTFICPCCGITFNTKHILKRHMENCYTEKMLKKETQMFENDIPAEEKTLKPNDKEKESSAEETITVYESCVGCSSIHIADCNFESPSFSLTLEQNKTHICVTCGRVFQTAYCLQSHLLLCTYKGRKPCQCIACGLYFMNLEALELHQNKTVEEVVGLRKCKRNRDILPCIICSEVHLIISGYREMVVRNGKSLEEISLQRYYEQHMNGCEQYSQNCNLVLSCPQSVKSNPHAQTANFKFVNEETCPICKDYVPEEERIEHVLLQHCKLSETQGDITHDSPANYSCVYCDKKFLLPVDAQLHLRLKHFRKPLKVRNHQKHSDGKGVADILHCPFCFKTFYDGETALKSHIKVHVQVEKKRYNQFWCVICEKSFSNIIFHKRLHSENKSLNQPQNQKRKMCDKCGKFVINLSHHKLLHAGIAKKYCNICGKIVHGNITIHKRIHKSELVCDICGKTVSNLRNHKEAVHFKNTKVTPKPHSL